MNVTSIFDRYKLKIQGNTVFDPVRNRYVDKSGFV